MEPNNPYQGPVSDPLPDTTAPLDIGPGRRKPIGHGWRWLAHAWQIVSRNKALWPLAFLVLSVIVLLVALVSMLIPFVGNLLMILIMPVFLVGLFQLAHRRSRDDTFLFGELFIGFSRKTGPLLLTGLAQLVLQIIYMVVMFVLIFAVFGSDLFRLFVQSAGGAGSVPTQSLAMGSILPVWKFMLFGLLMLALVIPYGAALYFQIPLVFFGDRSPFSALLESCKATLANCLPVLWYAILVFMLSAFLTVVFAIALVLINLLFGSGVVGGLLTFLVALAGIAVFLVLAATCFVGIYTAFEDIFGAASSHQRTM